MDIPGVPDSIPRSRIIELIKSLGLEPGKCAGFEFTPHVIHVEVYALKDGRRYWDGGDDSKAAKHRIAIPIADTPDTRGAGRDIVDAIDGYEDRQGPLGPEPQPA